MALATSTQRSYTAMFRIYLAFLIFNNITAHQVNLDTALACLEFVATNHLKVTQIRNYTSAIRHFSIRFSIPFNVWQQEKISLFFKALQKTDSFNVRLPRVIDL